MIQTLPQWSRNRRIPCQAGNKAKQLTTLECFASEGAPRLQLQPSPVRIPIQIVEVRYVVLTNVVQATLVLHVLYQHAELRAPVALQTT